MIRFDRSQASEDLQHGGRPYTLATVQWTIRVAMPGFGLGWSYRRPTVVRSGPNEQPIQDYVMWLRAAAVVAVVLATVSRRSRT